MLTPNVGGRFPVYRSLFPAMLLALSACAHHPPTQLTPRSGATAVLVDSVPWENEEATGYLRRVEVRFGNAIDTVPGVLTAEAPLTVGARVLGFAYRDEEIIGAFDYDADHRRLQRDALPAGFNGYFSAPSLAPDGRHIAYIVLPADAMAQAVVSTWPGGVLVWRSDAVEVPATDALGGNLTRWLSPDSAEIFIESGPTTETQWFHVVGSVREARVVRADTVRHPPSHFTGGALQRSVAIHQIAGADTVTSPASYGWGEHSFPGGKLYNIAGSRGVALWLRDGSQLRIGTDEPGPLPNAIRKAGQ